MGANKNHWGGYFSVPLLPPVLFHLKNQHPLKEPCLTFVPPCARELLQNYFVVCLDAVQLLEVQALSSPPNALYSCSPFPLLLSLTKTLPGFQYPGKVHAEYSPYYEIVRREGENEKRGGREKLLKIYWCYEKLWDSHHWLQKIVFKPLVSFMQPFRRKGLLISVLFWRTFLLKLFWSLSRNTQQYAGLTWKEAGL